MWQLSFAAPDEAAARVLCGGGGGAALLAEIVARCGAWHAPVRRGARFAAWSSDAHHAI
jgi:hypothetical protein